MKVGKDLTWKLIKLEENKMFGWAITFLIVAIVAALLGFTGVAGMAVEIAWILFVVGLVLFIVFLLLGRRRSPPL